MSRSNKELREQTLGTGTLEQARRGVSGRKRKLDDYMEEMETGVPKKKKKSKASDEESE